MPLRFTWQYIARQLIKAIDKERRRNMQEDTDTPELQYPLGYANGWFDALGWVRDLLRCDTLDEIEEKLASHFEGKDGHNI